MKLLLPIIIALMGLAGGAAVGVVMKPAPEVDPTVAEAPYEESEPELDEDFAKSEDSEYFELSRKLIVPVVATDGERSFVAIELHVELEKGGAEKAAAHEPKVRDALLRTVLSFAHTGAFDDDAQMNETFTELARELKLSARRVLGDGVRGVLIGDLIKQDA